MNNAMESVKQGWPAALQVETCLPGI